MGKFLFLSAQTGLLGGGGGDGKHGDKIVTKRIEIAEGI